MIRVKIDVNISKIILGLKGGPVLPYTQCNQADI
ncbi:Uncharacterised protein [Ewingella americana]|uniref:Uncharacterized protein n=1 Tax=Ewingella americana TaxID=41202 RepID=A0A377TE46_9GAMM|nr:Uncharacterised protein [Ewingella americana]